MERADQRGREPAAAPGGSSWAAVMLEVTGDSESDGLVAAAEFDTDDGDAESCCGGDDGVEPADGRRIVSWECWMVESAGTAVVGGEAAWPASLETEDDDAATGDAESDKLFWEACIAHGY
ncbi:hypothetical protein ACP70R_031610 [Stipagrostis hirtigluma subsp. patula]